MKVAEAAETCSYPLGVAAVAASCEAGEVDNGQQRCHKERNIGAEWTASRERRFLRKSASQVRKKKVKGIFFLVSKKKERENVKLEPDN
jgi:hypothetical protein